jgi:hypothetical protein
LKNIFIYKTIKLFVFLSFRIYSILPNCKFNVFDCIVFLSPSFDIYTSLSVRLSVSLSVRLSVSLSVRLSVSLSHCSASLSLCQSFCLSFIPYLNFLHLTIFLSLLLSLYPSLYLSLCLFPYLSLCLSLYLPVFLFFLLILSFSRRDGNKHTIREYEVDTKLTLNSEIDYRKVRIRETAWFNVLVSHENCFTVIAA